MFSDEGNNAVYTQLGGLFHKPFEAVVVLGGAAANGEMIGVGAPIGLLRENLRLGPFGAVVNQPAVKQRAQAVYHIYFIPCPVP